MMKYDNWRRGAKFSIQLIMLDNLSLVLMYGYLDDNCSQIVME